MFIKLRRSLVKFYLVAFHASIILWLIFGIMEILFQNNPFFPVYIRYIIINLYFPGPLWLLFTLEYLEILDQKRRYLRWLILAPAILSSIPSFIDRCLFLTIREIDSLRIVSNWGVLVYVNTAVGFSFFIISAVLLFRSARVNLPRRVKVLLVISLVLPILLIILNYNRLIPDPEINIVPVSLSFFISIVAVAIFKYNMIDLKPLASLEVYESTRDLVVVVDDKGRVIDVNPAGRNLFASLFPYEPDIGLDDFLDRLASHLLDAEVIRRIKTDLQLNQFVRLEENLSLYTVDGERREYTCLIVPLLDEGNRTRGAILTFSDMTEYHMAVVNNERVRLAGDLHDSIGHCLNTIIMNLEYVTGQTQGDAETARLIRTSYDRSINAMEDLRRIVHGLKPLDLENNGLIRALQNLFDKRRHKDLAIRFFHDLSDDHPQQNQKNDEAFYFICQEAVHNAMKHGQASQIDVILKRQNNKTDLYIADNGKGCKTVIEGNGLKNIKRRVKALDGGIEYGSPSDGGFNLLISLPNSSKTLIKTRRMQP
jgi:signal transduction histidine kinase